MSDTVALLVTFFGTIGLCAFAWIVPTIFVMFDRPEDRVSTDSVFFHYADSRKGGAK